MNARSLNKFFKHYHAGLLTQDELIRLIEELIQKELIKDKKQR